MLVAPSPKGLKCGPAMTSLDLDAICVPAPLAGLRRYALDGALLLFDPRTGLTAVCDGEETAHLRLRVPRVVQFGITNACNLACAFCSRDERAGSEWTVESALALLRALDAAGTLEVAFGGGEPLAFAGFARLVERLAAETRLAVSLTTNGTLLDDALAARLAPHLGQVRVSAHDGVDLARTVDTLQRHHARFGVNYLLTPERLASLEARVLEWVARGVRDVLLLAYNGRDRALHLSPDDAQRLGERVAVLARALEGRATLKLDICWGERLEAAPRLFGQTPCAAGREFISVSSERRVSPCSFHQHSQPFVDAADLLSILARERESFAAPSREPGCARAVGYGLSTLDTTLSLL